jgi:hypothetical protein
MSRKGTPTRRDRILVLLGTLNDIRLPETTGDTDDISHTHAGSRPLHHSELYHAGSYHDLDLCLEQLKHRAPRIHWHTIRVYVEKNPTSDGNGLAPEGRRLRSLHKANLGVRWLEHAMPTFILVPVDLLENEGYVLSTTQRKKIAA